MLQELYALREEGLQKDFWPQSMQSPITLDPDRFDTWKCWSSSLSNHDLYVIFTFQEQSMIQ